MTKPAATDARDLVSSPTPKLPHERDESIDEQTSDDTPEIQQAYDSVKSEQRDTSKAEGTDAAYNATVGSEGRQSGTSSGRTEPDPAAKK